MNEIPLSELLRAAAEPGSSTAVDQLAGRLAEIGAPSPAAALPGVADSGDRQGLH